MVEASEIKAEIQRRIKQSRAGRKSQSRDIRIKSQAQANALNDLMSWIDVRIERDGRTNKSTVESIRRSLVGPDVSLP